MTRDKPERIRWAVEVLSVQPTEKILEIGCGNGHALELICDLLTTGKIVGVDRSARAIHTARANNQRCVNAGKVQLMNAGIAEIRLNMRFDKVFAVNVNAFWTGPEQEIAILHTLMNAGSRLYLFYEPPSASQLEKVVEKSKRHLEAENFEIMDVVHKRLTSNDGVYILAKKGNT